MLKEHLLIKRVNVCYRCPRVMSGVRKKGRFKSSCIAIIYFNALRFQRRSSLDALRSRIHLRTLSFPETTKEKQIWSSPPFILNDCFKKAFFKKDFTGVSATGKKRKFLTTWHKAIFISSRANRMPMQFRGPIPNGMKAYWLGFTWLSESHLTM